MDNRMDVQNLFGLIKFISEEAAHILRETVPYGPDILLLTMEDLNELLPGECNFQLRRQIMGLIDVFLQAQAGQSMDSIPADVMTLSCEGLAPEVPQSKVLCTDESDKKQQQMAPLDINEADITDVGELLWEYADPAGEESESDPVMTVLEADHSSGPSGDHVPEVLQSNVDHSSEDMEEKPVATNNAKTLNITKDSELHRGGPKPVDEGSESEQRMNVSPMEHSTGHSGDITITGKDIDPVGEKSESDQKMGGSPADHSTGSSGETSRVWFFGEFSRSLFRHKNYSFVKVHMLIAGEIFYTHETFMQKLNLQIERDCSAKNSNVILVFCRVVSHIRTDMEAAMARVTENKPVILVFMHHCHNPSHMTNITVEPSRSNIVQVVHCAFHESKGLLRCQENDQAVDAVRSALLRYK